jgi:hypothetical protein
MVRHGKKSWLQDSETNKIRLRRTEMHRSLKVFFVIAIALFVSGCERKPDPAVEACVERGIAYFKEIGSYPTLKSSIAKGQRAIDVARERCNRTTTAF